MTGSRVIGVEDPAWADALARLPEHDVYHTPQWHAAFNGIGGRQGKAYLAEVDDEILLYPFFLRATDEGGVDLESAYGYSGPLASTARPELLHRAWRDYDVWAHDVGVACEFSRFNPFAGTERFAHPETVVFSDRQTVWIALDQGLEALWSGYEQTQRARVRKAERGGLTCVERALEIEPLEFARFYRDAMIEVGAPSFYMFPDDHFFRLAKIFGDRIQEFRVLSGGELLASALFICWSDRFHYHLAATPRATRALCPTNLLLHKAAVWAMERGYRVMHLGGGRTANPADDLLAFKRQFSPLRADFRIGRRITEPARYERLCTTWLERNPGPRPTELQFYRLPDRSSGASLG